MNKIIFSRVITIVICICTICIAQTKPTVTVATLSKGSKALQFGIYNLNITSFQGATISYKMHISNKVALRYGVTISGRYSDSEDTVTGSYSSQNRSDRDEDHDHISHTYRLNLGIQLLKFSAENNKMQFYIGTGPRLSYYYSKYTNNDIYKYDEGINSDRREVKEDTYGIGIDFPIGVEWKIRTNLGIHAEYISNFTFFSSTSRVDDLENNYYNDEKSVYESEGHSKGLDFGSRVLFGVSLYF